MACKDQQLFVFSIGLEINSRDDSFVEQERQDVITPFAFIRWYVNLYTVVKIEQALGPWSKPDDGIEW